MLKKSLATLVCSAVLATVGFASSIGYRYLGKIQTSSPAFISVEKFEGQPEFLLISEFSALSSGKVSVIPNIGHIINERQFSQARRHQLSDSFLWPNELTVVPSDVFGPGINAIHVPDGFLPPGKTNGNIFIMTTHSQDVTGPA